MRRAILLATALATALAMAAPAAGTSQTEASFQVSGDRQPYLIIMEGDPVVAYDGDISGLPATKPARGKKINPNSAAVRKYVDHLEKGKAEAQNEAGVGRSQVLVTYNYALNGFAAALTETEAKRLAKQDNVISVIRDELHQLHTDTSPDFLGLTDSNGAWASGYTGEGVVVGVVDTGIWPEHPSFADDGSYPDPPITLDEVVLDADNGFVSSGCDFGDTAHNPADVPFECNDKLVGARDMRTLYKTFIGPEVYNSARDYNGHGTHTSGTAAGNADVEASIFGIDRGTISGVAHRAHVVMYSACGDLGCFGGDLADAIDQAVADGVDVINYSIGSTTPALIGGDEFAFLFAADAGVYVATSNGNSGPGAGTIGSPASVPWLTSVGANTHDRRFEGTVTLGNGDTYSGASVTPGVDTAQLVDAAQLRNELCDPAVMFTPPPNGQIVLCKRGLTARVAKSQAVFEQGGVGMILYNSSATETLATDNHFVPSVHVSLADGLAIKDYIASTAKSQGKGPGAGQGKALGKKAEAFISQGEAVAGPGSVMADFSSRGPVGSPASADIIKPDVTAPGVQILAGNSPTPTLGAPGELFQAIQGTSMSSPHVAGLFALIKQAQPLWSAAAAKSALMTTARQDVLKEDETTDADPFDMGSGHVDPSGDASAPNSIFNPGIVYDAGFIDYLGFLCDAAPEAFANPAGTCGFLGSIGIPLTSENLNYPSIGASQVPGVQTVTRTVTNVSGGALSLTADVVAPPGFDVSVDPAVLNIAAGADASFDVTFTRTDAPIGQWRFGSLTWEGDGYSARSPIAVAAAQLDAPDLITGTGIAGTDSFDIKFGYDGVYDATAHGLVADVLIPGSVTQDEDQTFHPSDVGDGATAHDIVLAGSALLRITLDTADLSPSLEAIDLDLFLYKDGDQIASSTAGSTHEIIELQVPEDGTYTLYVHGWQTTDVTVEYTLHTWDVPLTADSGSLTVIGESGTAVIGATETLTIGWSGLDTGTKYLGAVGHNDGDGLFDLTVVEVNTE